MCLTWAKNNLLLENDVFKEVLFSKEEKLFWQQKTRITCHWSYAPKKEWSSKKLEIKAGKTFSFPPTKLMLEEEGQFIVDSRAGIPYIKPDGTEGVYTGLVRVKYDKTYVACYFLFHYPELLDSKGVEGLVALISDTRKQLDGLDAAKDSLGNPLVGGEIVTYMKTLDPQLEV